MLKFEIVWKDLNSTPYNPVAKYIDAVKESINNVLSVNPGQFLFNPIFGVDLEELLFELCDEDTARNIRIKLYSLGRWDSRYRVNMAKTQVIPIPEHHEFSVHLVLDIVGENDPFTFQFSLKKQLV